MTGAIKFNILGPLLSAELTRSHFIASEVWIEAGPSSTVYEGSISSVQLTHTRTGDLTKPDPDG